jgi:hypothetical protein
VAYFRDSEYLHAEEVLQDTTHKLIKCPRLQENILLCVFCSLLCYGRKDLEQLSPLTPQHGKYKMRLICSKCDCNRLRFGDRRDFTHWKGQKTLLICRYQTSERATGSTQTTSSPKVHHFLVFQQSALSDIGFCVPFSVSPWIRTFLIVPCRSLVSIHEDLVMAAIAGCASRKLCDSCQPYPCCSRLCICPFSKIRINSDLDSGIHMSA